MDDVAWKKTFIVLASLLAIAVVSFMFGSSVPEPVSEALIWYLILSPLLFHIATIGYLRTAGSLTASDRFVLWTFWSITGVIMAGLPLVGAYQTVSRTTEPIAAMELMFPIIYGLLAIIAFVAPWFIVKPSTQPI